MNLSSIFINRPIATSLLGVAIALAGILSFYLLPVAPLPQIEFPTIVVSASLSGASPEIMASSVATPIEKQLTRIAGITDMTSTSSLGNTRIIIQFDLARNIDGAARDVQAAINASAADLPHNLLTRPTYRKINPSDSPIMIICLTSDDYTIDKIYDYASTELQQKILQVNGVGQVTLGGSSLPAVRIDANLNKINKYNISLSDIKSAISSSNINLATGQIEDDFKGSDILLNDQIFNAKDYEKIIVNQNHNSIVRISDIAKVTDSVQDIRNQGLLNGKPTVAIVIFKTPGANIIDTVKNIEDTIPLLKSMIPKAINLTIVMDRTSTIKASLKDVKITLLLSAILVSIVIFIFLGSFRAMIIPSIAMTLSLLGTFAVMKLMGFSLNNLSLMALTIATGFVVDDAIVVLENISRYIEHGMTPKDAALKGAKEIVFTVTSISISLIAVFVPIIFMDGIIGRLFREFSLTLSISIIISLLVSLSLTPMMCAKFFKPATHVPHESWLQKFYRESLKKALAHKKTMLFITIATIILNICLFIIIPKGFFPQQDTGRIISSIVTDQDSSFINLQEKFTKFIDIIKDDNAVENVAGFIGSGSTNSGSIFILLKDPKIRKITSDQVIERLRPKLGNVSGATVYMQSAQDILIGGKQGTAQFQYTISGDTISEVNQYTPIFLDQIAKITGVTDVNNDQRNQGLQSYVKVNYDKAALLGITTKEVDNTLYSAFGQTAATTMYRDMNQYYVILELATENLKNPEMLKEIYVKSITGNLVPLAAFATFKKTSTLLSVNHQGLAPSATISFNLLPNIALGDIVSKIEESVAKLKLPATISSEFRGTAQAFTNSLKNEPYLILASLIAVYIVLGILYENLIHPITIISTLPSAGVGALLALLITGTDLSVIAIIGIVLLIGIVKKNAIMMIDFVLEIKKTKDISSEEAIFEAAIMRFRPITMTTLAAILGAVPLAFGDGVGAEIRKPLGISIIGGLIASQMLTLYTTPVIYLAMEKLGWSNKTKNPIIIYQKNLKNIN